MKRPSVLARLENDFFLRPTGACTHMSGSEMQSDPKHMPTWATSGTSWELDLEDRGEGAWISTTRSSCERGERFSSPVGRICTYLLDVWPWRRRDLHLRLCFLLRCVVDLQG